MVLTQGHPLPLGSFSNARNTPSIVVNGYVWRFIEIVIQVFVLIFSFQSIGFWLRSWQNVASALKTRTSQNTLLLLSVLR